MTKYLLICAALVSFLNAQASDSLIQKAIELFETRHLNRSNLSESRDVLEDVIGREPNNTVALCELSHVCYLLGDEATTKGEKLALYNKGMEYGKRAIKLNGNSEWAHFWYLVNLGRVGQTKGVLHSLGSVPEFKKEVDKVLKINPNHTGALDARAMLYYELPGILGGNLNRSLESLNKGIAIDSNYSLLYVDMAKVYMKKKDYEKARWYLNRLLAIEKPTYEADHMLDDKPDALRMLEEIKDK